MLFDFIRGGQILSHNIEMFKQVIKKLFVFSFFITCTFLFIKLYKDLNLYQVKNTYYYIIAENYVNTNRPNTVLTIEQDSKQKIKLKAIDIVNNMSLKKNKINTIKTFHQNLLISISMYCFIFVSITFIFLINGYILNRNHYLRGAKIVSLKILNKIIKKYNKKNKHIFQKEILCRKTEQLVGFKTKHYDYTIANALYPVGTETIHTIITGASGTGKTVLITDLINQIRKNGDRAIIYDKMGTFVSKFFNGEEINKKIDNLKKDDNISEKRKKELIEYYNLEKDIILNPIDVRSPYWSVFNEARDSLDFDNIASALIPENTNNDPFWNTAARILFSSVANRLKEEGNVSNQSLTDKLLTINLKEAASLVRGTPAQSIIDEQNSKTALSVMAMISTNLRSLMHLREREEKIDENGTVISQEEPFSIRKWVQNDNQEGFLFISSRADRHDTLKPLISTWLDIAINSLLSLNQSSDRKIWIIIDELPSLYYLPSLHTGLAESRQFGGCFVLSLQLMAQLRAIYGKEKAESTSGLCRNRIILNTPDEDTAKWCSDNLGKSEVQEVKESISFGACEWKDGVNINKQDVQKNIILPTEIMQLPNLQAYIKFAGDFPVAKSKFKYKKFPQISERYIERNFDKNNVNYKQNTYVSAQEFNSINNKDTKKENENSVEKENEEKNNEINIFELE